ncbi:MAG TPA: PVC-type heme-binding CxxCH protein [Planctomycetaceae bacterium]|nr:PVC-type heme-binding CxxCH protein [Planctomycetaceae bacterium]
MPESRHWRPKAAASGTRTSLLLFLLVSWITFIGRPALAAEDEHPAAKAVAGLDVAPGLAATLFASEPMIASPTNIDVDDKGRVWVCEVVNYRRRAGTRPAGDRILILEDTDGDGRADKSTVFYQGRDIDSAMGICVLGNRVIVTCSPNVFVFTDTNGDGKADKKEVLFTKTGSPQHDHSAHTFLFGPDGRLYWNFGNQGKSVHDYNGKPVVDIFGRTVVDDGHPYHGGMAFRCGLDGSNFEVLAHNFRNNYELTVDSFGGLWQSDNDDDGNRSVRINFLLEYGNYGYRDEMTGASWTVPRTNLESEIPARHWHQNDPGTVPNVLITGAGAPSGICVYEGNLLPSVFHDQVIHCDPGVNVVRAYPMEKVGAGYRAKIVDVLKGTRDNWFRPSDVCVAPDGSLIVADWYDPGVGGHHMGDITHGRIFRVAPPHTPYRAPHVDYSTIPGAIEALKSPNLATRYLAWTALAARGTAAEPALAELFEHAANPRIRARALWLLGAVSREPETYVAKAAADANPDLRVTAIRLARKLRTGLAKTVASLVHDPSPEVRRECAIAVRNLDGPQKSAPWVELAAQYDGHDRWYLEALGIGADGDWDACLAAWLNKVGSNWKSPASRDIVWRSRAAQTPQLLAELIEDPATPAAELPRYLRAFDFLKGPEKERVLVDLAFGDAHRGQGDLIAAEAIQRLDRQTVLNDPSHAAALKRVVDGARGTQRFVDLIQRFNLPGYAGDLVALAQKNPENDLGVQAVEALLALHEEARLAAALSGRDPQKVIDTIRVLGSAQIPHANRLLTPILNDPKRPLEERQEALRAICRTKTGAAKIMAKAEAGKLEPELRETASAALHASAVEDIRNRADKLYPLRAAADAKRLPPMRQLAKRLGDPHKGHAVFATNGTCVKCHIVNGEGKEVGPNLSEIGAKLSRLALYESILFPSAAISHNFEAYTVVLANGNVISGLLVNRTAESIAIKGADALTHTYRTSDVEEIKQQPISLMPADLQKGMTADDLVNVVEYLTTLKKAAPTKPAGHKEAAARP